MMFFRSTRGRRKMLLLAVGCILVFYLLIHSSTHQHEKRSVVDEWQIKQLLSEHTKQDGATADEISHLHSNPPQRVIINSAQILLNQIRRCSIGMGVKEEQLETESFREVTQFALNLLHSYQAVVPSSFLPDYKSPCWYSNISQHAATQLAFLDGFDPKVSPSDTYKLTHHIFKTSHSNNHLLCLPYFFIAGFPKSATTTLDVALRKHSQVVGPTTKEPHWWTRGPHTKSNSSYLGALSVARYALFFEPLSNALVDSSRHDMITFDASQSTLWDSPISDDYCVLPAVMSTLLPNAKFVVVMRSPMDRLISHYIWSCKFHNGEDISKWPHEVLTKGPSLFHEQALQIIHWLEQCEEKASLYECLNTRKFDLTSHLTNTCGKIGHRLGIGIYHVHIRKWLQCFKKEQFLFLRMEDLINFPYETMKKVTTFLDITPVSEKEATQWFHEKANQRTKEQDSLFRIQEYSLELLRSFYAPHNEQLALLLGDNRFLWNDNNIA